MATSKTVLCAAVLALAGGVLAGLATAQDNKPAPDPVAEWLKSRGIQVTPEQIEQGRKMMEDFRNGVQPDPEQLQKLVTDVSKQMQSRAALRIKEALGATDAEWLVLGPKVEKVQSLMLQTQVGGMGMGMGLGRMGLGGLNLTGSAEPSDFQKKSQALQELMKNKDAPVDDVRTALKDYRQAKEQAKTDLTKARGELKELLTVRQEAVLVRLSLLE